MDEFKKEVIKLGFDYYKKLIKNLGLDEDLFSHIYDTEFSYDKKESMNNEATYDSFSDLIYLNNEILEEKYYEYLLTKNERIKNEIAHTITHELIHATRTIFIENGIHSLSESKLKNFSAYELNKKRREKEFLEKAKKTTDDIDNIKENTIKYNNYLSKLLNDPFYSSLSPYIPVKITYLGNNKYDVVAYYEEERNFSDEKDNPNIDIISSYKIYKNEEFGIDENLSPKDVIVKISNELKEFNHKPVITSYLNDKNNLSIVKCDYYLDYEYDFYNEIKGSIDNIDKYTDEEFKSYVDTESQKLIDNVTVNLKLQSTFEENITETLAVIANLTYKKDKIDLDELSYKFIENDFPYDLIFGIKILSSLGIDGIKWFLTSTYDNEYINRFKKEFENNYVTLLKLSNKAYDYEKYYDEIDEVDEKLDDIIDEKTSKKI